MMDMSGVQSGAKCSSDFSIDRILSDDSRNSREGASDAPSWLCCTRYRPPRLPRSSASSACRARRSGRHARVPFTGVQAAALEAAYARAPYLAPPALRALAAALQLRDDRIKIWFQNRRARERREKCVNITPPRDVNLPPTQRLLPGPCPLLPHRNISPMALTPEPFQRNDSTIVVSMEAPHGSDNLYVPTYYNLPFRDTPNADSRSETPVDIESIED